MYSVDTNVFLDWWDRRYPPDVFACVKKSIEQLIAENKIFAPERVLEEIESVGSSGLIQWVKQHKKIFVQHDTRLQEEAQKIQFRYPDLIDTTTPYDEADRWIIALANIQKLIVVTHETYARKKKNPERKLYIPDVCKSMNIRCIELLALMRNEQWHFD